MVQESFVIVKDGNKNVELLDTTIGFLLCKPHDIELLEDTLRPKRLNKINQLHEVDTEHQLYKADYLISDAYPGQPYSL